jgi:hypothetical protein
MIDAWNWASFFAVTESSWPCGEKGTRIDPKFVSGADVGLTESRAELKLISKSQAELISPCTE